MKHEMNATESRLRDLILKQVQSRYFDKIQELSSRLDLADFENKRLRERFSALQKQLVHMKEEGTQAVSNKSIIRKKHVGIQVKLGVNSSTSSSEAGSLNSSRGKEEMTHESQFFEDLLLGGCGFESRSSGGKLINLPSSLTVTPVKSKPSATALCPAAASVFITPEAASADTEQFSDQSLSLFPTPDITPQPPHRTSSFNKPCKRKLKDDPSATTCSSPISSRSPPTCPVFLRKVSANQGKVAISWNMVRESSCSREISQISSYELYQASPVKMWQLVGVFQALKLPIAVVMSSVKQKERYQLRLKVVFGDGTFTFSNILSFIA